MSDNITTWEQMEKERLEYAKEVQERTFQLQERQIAAQERMAGMANMPIANDGPAERWQSFFNLSDDQQDFWLRDVAIRVASNIDGCDDLFATADKIVAYIKNGQP